MSSDYELEGVDVRQLPSLKIVPSGVSASNLALISSGRYAAPLLTDNSELRSAFRVAAFVISWWNIEGIRVIAVSLYLLGAAELVAR
jgi:hypothetical protein